MIYKINVPLHVYLKRKTKKDKKVIINLNNYRNWHYFISNEIKKEYKNQIKSELVGLKFLEPIIINFKLFKKSRRTSDRSNVLSIHEKFFCDSLVELGCIVDDNDDYIISTHYASGSIDKENPRVEITIATQDANKHE